MSELEGDSMAEDKDVLIEGAKVVSARERLRELAQTRMKRRIVHPDDGEPTSQQDTDLSHPTKSPEQTEAIFPTSTATSDPNASTELEIARAFVKMNELGETQINEQDLFALTPSHKTPESEDKDSEQSEVGASLVEGDPITLAPQPLAETREELETRLKLVLIDKMLESIDNQRGKEDEKEVIEGQDNDALSKKKDDCQRDEMLFTKSKGDGIGNQRDDNNDLDDVVGDLGIDLSDYPAMSANDDDNDDEDDQAKQGSVTNSNSDGIISNNTEPRSSDEGRLDGSINLNLPGSIDYNNGGSGDTNEGIIQESEECTIGTRGFLLKGNDTRTVQEMKENNSQGNGNLLDLLSVLSDEEEGEGNALKDYDDISNVDDGGIEDLGVLSSVYTEVDSIIKRYEAKKKRANINTSCLMSSQLNDTSNNNQGNSTDSKTNITNITNNNNLLFGPTLDELLGIDDLSDDDINNDDVDDEDNGNNNGSAHDEGNDASESLCTNKTIDIDHASQSSWQDPVEYFKGNDVMTSAGEDNKEGVSTREGER